MNRDQRAWLSWSNPPFKGEDDWRWTGMRPITRNKVISTAAHLTSQLLFPNIFAQNEFDQEDREAANVMRELVEYNIRRSNYETCFLYGVISGLVNPVSYWKVDYVKGWQEMWQDGKKEKVVDDMFSGFQNALIPTEEVLIGNAYQFDLQKQDWIIHKRRISYGEAEARYGDHSNFKHVKPGVHALVGEDNLFYDVEDINDDLVEEVCYKSRRNDEEIYFINSIYVGNNNPEYNPMYHRNNQNKPRYNMVKYGAEPIDAMRFFFYKSLVAKMSNDQEAVDREWQMYFDAGFLATFPPTVTMGAGKIDKSVISPATTTDLPLNAKIEPLNIANPTAALQALREAERSVVESSMDNIGQGIEGQKKTARESILLQQNMQTNLGIMGKMIGSLVKGVGELMVDDIIRYQTIAEASEITGKEAYKSFLLDGKVKGGRQVTSQIRFTDRLLGMEMSDEDKRKANIKLYEESGDGREIFDVNPEAFAKMQYLITIDADAMLQRNDAFERAMKLEIYDRAIASPLIQSDPEAMNKITRDFLLEPLMKGEASKYLPEISTVAMPLIPNMPSTKAGTGLTKRAVAGGGMEAAFAV